MNNIDLTNLNNIPYKIIHKYDSFSNREQIKLFETPNVQFSEKCFYPDVILKTEIHDNVVYLNPIDEQIMSLKNIENNPTNSINFSNIIQCEERPVFYFIYNVENYYHFIYDSLPYLDTYFKLLEKLSLQINDIPLLINYQNREEFKLYDFVIDTLNILGIRNIIFVDKNTLYKKMYISTSYTHGGKSNNIFNSNIKIWDRLLNNCISSYNKNDFKIYDKIYISRRAWVHGNYSNIGTNYTLRRKMQNEDDLVMLLNKNGYTEVFTETLSMIEKIFLFNNATHIVGAIGGGLVNVLFSNPNTKLISIISPTFLHVNFRFIYSFYKLKDVMFFTNTEHIELDVFKKYMRVQYRHIVGEVINVFDKEIEISYFDHKVAGWNNNLRYKTMIVNKSDCKILDHGLNSEWKINLNSIKDII